MRVSFVLYGAAALTLSACTKLGPQQRMFYDQQRDQMLAVPPAVLIDSCVIRHTADQSFVLRRESSEIADAVRARVEPYLRDRGMAPVSFAQPMACGFVEHGEALVAEHVDAEPVSSPVPVVVRADLARDAPLAEAYRQLYASLERSPPTPYFEPGPGYAGADLGLSVETSKRLKADLRARRLIVVRTQAPSLSARTQFLHALANAAVSVPAGLPGMTFVRLPGGGTIYQVMAVDLDGGKLVWKKHRAADRNTGARARAYDGRWDPSMFDPFIDPDPPE